MHPQYGVHSWVVQAKAGEMMGGLPPENRKHPTHLRTWGVWVASWVVAAACGVMLGVGHGHSVVVPALVVGFVMSVMGGFAWLAFRLHFLRCATCGRWLRPRFPWMAGVTQKFLCPKCNVLWDSAFEVGVED